MKSFVSFVFVLALLMSSRVNGQTLLTMAPYDGDECSFELSTRSSVTFASDSIVLHLRTDNDATVLYPLDDVRKLFFTETIITNVNDAEHSQIILYPNPVGDGFTIDGIERSTLLVIYTMSGDEVLRTFYQGGRVNVSNLSPGNYLLIVGDKVGKFAKK